MGAVSKRANAAEIFKSLLAVGHGVERARQANILKIELKKVDIIDLVFGIEDATGGSATAGLLD